MNDNPVLLLADWLIEQDICDLDESTGMADAVLGFIQSKFRISRIGEGETFDSGEHPMTMEHNEKCEVCK